MTTGGHHPRRMKSGTRRLPQAPTCLRGRGGVRASVQESAGILHGGDAYF
jgi:hypothetical protein